MRLLTIITSAAIALAAGAQDINSIENVETTIVPQEEILVDLSPRVENPVSHFAWGIDLGAAIDMTSNDMSFIDIHANLGYRNDWMRFAGIGAGINMMLSNSSRSYPVYAMARTSFSSRPQLSFLEAKVGCAFNSIDSYSSQTDFYGSLGWGITLASSRTFTSHIVLSYVFMPLHDVTTDTGVQHMPDLHYAALKIGASF